MSVGGAQDALQLVDGRRRHRPCGRVFARVADCERVEIADPVIFTGEHPFRAEGSAQFFDCGGRYCGSGHLSHEIAIRPHLV